MTLWIFPKITSRATPATQLIHIQDIHKTFADPLSHPTFGPKK